MVNPPFPSKHSICYTGCISYPCSSQKCWKMVETCAPVSIRAVTQMSPTKISASLAFSINLTVASGLWYWGPVTNFIGCGVALALVQVSHSVWVLGDVMLLLPILELKALHVWCWSIHVTYAPNPGSYSIGFGFDHSPSLAWFWLFQAALFWLLFCLWGLWPILLVFWLLFLWLWFYPIMGAHVGYFEPFSSGY